MARPKGLDPDLMIRSDKRRDRMSTEIKFWQILNSHIANVDETSFATNHLEAELENWIVECPDILGQDLLIIARQKYIESVGQLDLLAIDTNGVLAIIELKRDMAPREAVAQAIHYASWLDETSEREIVEIAEAYLKRPLEEVFIERFDVSEMPAIVPQNHRIIVVAVRLDAAAERIINYLARRAAININALFFRYASLGNSTEILARSILVADSVVRVSPKAKLSAADLVSTATKRQVLPMLERFREFHTEEYVWEEPTVTYGGSFRFWRKNTDGNPKMVFGLNVSGDRCDTPDGQLDLWIPIKSLAQVLNVPEDQSKDLLKSLPVFEMKPSDCIVRLENQQAADGVAKKIRDWFNKYPGIYGEEA